MHQIMINKNGNFYIGMNNFVEITFNFTSGNAPGGNLVFHNL